MRRSGSPQRGRGAARSLGCGCTAALSRLASVGAALALGACYEEIPDREISLAVEVLHVPPEAAALVVAVQDSAGAAVEKRPPIAANRSATALFKKLAEGTVQVEARAQRADGSAIRTRSASGVTAGLSARITLDMASACQDDPLVGQSCAGTCPGSRWSCAPELACAGPPEACNSADDDCDGLVDEGCPCAPGETRICYPPGLDSPTLWVGSCSAGNQVCADGQFAETCAGAAVPAEETCADGADNDCDDQVDCDDAGECPSGSACGVGSVCDLSSCREGCWIGGVFRQPSSLHPFSVCRRCDPAVSVHDWTPLPDQTVCGACRWCDGGVCTLAPPEVDVGACDGSSTCDGAGGCARKSGQQCDSGSECATGSCADATCCDSPCTGACDRCDRADARGICSPAPAGSAGSPSCSPYVCDGSSTGCPASCDGASDCGPAFACSGQGACELKPGQACDAGSECVSGYCVDGKCCDGPCSGKCRACAASRTGGANGTCANVLAATDPDGDCLSTQLCSAGACRKKTGQACDAGSECVTGSCVDGRCCQTDCAGDCRACSAAKTGLADGVCGLIPAGDDPDGECAGGQCCNGACCAGCCDTTPQPDVCLSIAGQTTSKCGAGGPLCNGCPSTHTCSGGVCKKNIGQSCNPADGDCLLGHCVDGFCCDAACGSPCYACSAVKSGGANGACTAVPAGADPDNDCTGGQCCNGACCAGCCDTSAGAGACLAVGSQPDDACGSVGNVCSNCGGYCTSAGACAKCTSDSQCDTGLCCENLAGGCHTKPAGRPGCTKCAGEGPCTTNGGECCEGACNPANWQCSVG